MVYDETDQTAAGKLVKMKKVILEPFGDYINIFVQKKYKNLSNRVSEVQTFTGKTKNTIPLIVINNL